MRLTAMVTSPFAVLVGLDRPRALIVLLVLSVFVGALTRVGLWLLGEPAGDPDTRAAHAALVTFVAGVALAASVLVLGPLTVLLVVPATVLVTLWLRPGRGSSSVLAMPLVERPAGER